MEGSLDDEIYSRARAYLGRLVGGRLCLDDNPLYTKDNSVQDPRIQGIWFCDDLRVDGETRRESLSIRPHDDEALPFESDIPGYAIVFDTVNSSEVFEAKLVILGAHQYFDVYSLKGLARPDAVPVHNILRVTLVNNQLAVAAIDRQKLEQVIASEEPSLAMAHVGGRVVLTGSTAELQAFLSMHGDQVFGAERRYSKRLLPNRKSGSFRR